MDIDKQQAQEIADAVKSFCAKAETLVDRVNAILDRNFGAPTDAERKPQSGA